LCYPKKGITHLLIGVVVGVGALASALPILICVFGTMGIGIGLAKKGKL